MHPILLRLGPVTLYAYGVALAAAFLTATGLAARTVRRLGAAVQPLTEPAMVSFCYCALLGGIAGGRLFYVVLHWEVFQFSWGEIPALWEGGLVWYGGFLGGVAAGWLYCRLNRLSFLPVVDLLAPFIALGHAIGRIGCFLNGCCYGKATTAWCGVVFPGHDTPVLPTQLFETVGLLVVSLAVRRLQTPERLRHPGRVFGAYLIGYAVLRFFLEGLRGDQPIWWAGLTLQQAVSLGVLVGGALLWRQRHNGTVVSVRGRPGGRGRAS